MNEILEWIADNPDISEDEAIAEIERRFTAEQVAEWVDLSTAIPRQEVIA